MTRPGTGPARGDPDGLWTGKALALIDVLDRSGIPFAFGGAIALNYHREPRSTLDIDVNVFVPPGRRAEVLGPLAARLTLGPDELERVSRDVERDGQARAAWGTTDVDLFFADTAFHDAMAARVRRVPFADGEAPVLSIEDLLVCKVLFDRPKDWLDVAAVAEHEGEGLDVGHIVLWLRTFLPDDDPRFERLGRVLGG